MGCTKPPHFMALPKTGLITNKRRKTPTLPDNFQSKLLHPVKRFIVRAADPIYGFT
jgi:hypothetical protein